MESVKMAHTGPARITTGIPGCDEILGGGLISERTYLIAGSPGCGKTIFSLQWLRHSLSRGQKCLYITLSEPLEQLQKDASGFGWDLDGIEIIDLSSSALPSDGMLGEYHIFSPGDVENTPIWQSILDAIKENTPDCIVIDSVTQLKYLSTDEYQFRKNITRLVSHLNGLHVTSFFLFEPLELEQDASVALAVDGVIRLRSGVSSELAIGVRSIQVEKLRSSDFMSGYHPLRISSSGITVFPHRIERTGPNAPGEEILSSGIEGLDELLQGGLESGTTTLITGPTGTGKSTLGTQFLATQAKYHPAILFTFEEPQSFIAERCRNIGSPIDNVLASGALKIVRINPLEQYPDEFLAEVRKAVEEEGRTTVMIDSLRGYQFAMEEFGRPQAHIHNLITYLSRNSVTTLLINEVESITSASLRATDLGVSHLADNIILLRYAEFEGAMNKVVCCLKKRVGSFEPELRKIFVGKDGMQVSGKLSNLTGILSGMPTSVE